MNQKYTDKKIRNLDTGTKVATGVGAAVGVAKAAVGLGLIAKTTAAGSAIAGPIGTAAGLLAGLTAAGINAINSKKKEERAKDKEKFEEKSTIATEVGAERIAEKEAQLRQKPAPYGMSYDPDDPANINTPLLGEDAATAVTTDNREPISSKNEIPGQVGLSEEQVKNTINPASQNTLNTIISKEKEGAGKPSLSDMYSNLDKQERDFYRRLDAIKIPKTEVKTDSLVNPEVANAMNTASKLDAVGNLINSGVAIAGLINSMNAKPVEKVHTQIAKAPKEPERIDDNTEAIRAMAESQIQGNLGAAEKQMIEMGVNPAMAQSIKTSQGNQASLGINANLAQNKQAIQVANAQMGNQHEQFATQVGMQNAQSINQMGQFNAQNQAMANQYNSQALMQSLGALGKSTSNIGKIKLDKALMYGDLEMNALQQAYFKKMMGV